MAQPKILVIVGPTASGKSDLAVRLAKKFNGEIISADSRQVYKELDIGTGKITKQEKRGVPHYLLDVADPRKRFTVSDYKKLADDNIRYIVSCGKLPIIVGGTGFYIDVLTGAASFPDVPPNKLLRRKFDKLSKEMLFEMLRAKDSRRAREIDPRNKVRLIRALEIIEKYGSVPQLGSSTSKYDFVFIGLVPTNLEQRIYDRLLKRIPGIIRETRKLSFKRAYELGLEYRYTALYLKKKLSRKEMIEQLYTAIRQYAKRQMTWFKRNKEIRWFQPEEYKKIEKYVRSQL